MGVFVSGLIFTVFLTLLVVGATSTISRVMRYRNLGLKAPLLLYRDRDLILGLALPPLLIGAVRAFDLYWFVFSDGQPHLWYVLLTGLPPVYAVARYCYFELFVIERNGK